MLCVGVCIRNVTVHFVSNDRINTGKNITFDAGHILNRERRENRKCERNGRSRRDSNRDAERNLTVLNYV